MPTDEEVAALAEARARRLAGTVALATGAALHLVVLTLVVATVRVTGPASGVALLVAWVGGAVAIGVLGRRRPLTAMLVPFAVAAIAWLVLRAG